MWILHVLWPIWSLSNTFSTVKYNATTIAYSREQILYTRDKKEREREKMVACETYSYEMENIWEKKYELCETP